MSDSFWSSLWGSFLGFVFAIILFYIIEKVKSYQSKKELKKLLKKECKYNLSQFEEWISVIEKVLTEVGADISQTYGFVNYENFASYFLQRSYQEGIMFDLIKDKDVKEMAAMFTRYNLNGQTYINGLITSWRSNEITKQDITAKLNHELSELKESQKIFGELISDLD